MEEKRIVIEYDITAEDAYSIIIGLLNELGVKYEDNGEGVIKYWIEKSNNG
jgi:hypothetical protein